MIATPFATHATFNQSPPFEDINLYACDAPLMEAVKREGAGSAANRLRELGAKAGSAEGFEIGRLANEHAPKLKRFDQKGVIVLLAEDGVDAALPFIVVVKLHAPEVAGLVTIAHVRLDLGEQALQALRGPLELPGIREAPI